jgi:hypothetical protein
MPWMPEHARQRCSRRPLHVAATLALCLAIGPIATTPVAAFPAVADETRGSVAAFPVVDPAPTAIEPGAVDRASHRLNASYRVSLRLGWLSRSLEVNETILLRNTSGGPIDRVELNAVPARLGGLRLGRVLVDGRNVEARIDDQTIIVPLGGVLPEGASATVRLAFRATLRTTTGGSDWMFSKRNGIIDMYRWLPWISRRLAFDRPNHGDPFVSPTTSSVRLTITTDRPLDIAINARRVSVSANGLTQAFEATDVRDIPLTAAPDYRITKGSVDGIAVRVYTRPGGLSASQLLSRARSALARMADLVGGYPYGTFRVAESAGGWAMEGPGIIWIPRGTASSNVPYLVAHETAHQWFYGLVGNDQAAQPFADEAAADFLARHVLGLRRGSRCSTARLDRSIYGYSRACYYEIVYIQGGNLLDDLRRKMGNATFWRALRGYVADQRFALSTTQSLLTALDEATPLDLEPTYRKRFPRYY